MRGVFEEAPKPAALSPKCEGAWRLLGTRFSSEEGQTGAGVAWLLVLVLAVAVGSSSGVSLYT